MNPTRFDWRPMLPGDLAVVEAIAGMVHPGFFEAPEVFAEKLSLYPEGCHLLEIGGEPAGYVFAHPWRDDEAPALNAPLGSVPVEAGSFYIHDLALLSPARGTGAAGRIVASLSQFARAQGFARMALVAVNGSLGFWQKQGFEECAVPELADKLAAYEAAARYMVRRLR
jgi:GNAT superfamily N-acetyltransferase